MFPPLIADARPKLAKALVLLEPIRPPFQEAVFANRAARAWGLGDAPLTHKPSVQDYTRDLVKVTCSPRDNNHSMCTLQAEKPAPR